MNKTRKKRVRRLDSEPRDEVRLDVAAACLRRAAATYSAALLETSTRRELQALDALYRFADDYSNALHGRSKRNR